MTLPLYPMALRPRYVERVWGGDAIFRALGRARRGISARPIGESWEVSAHPAAESLVANGPLRGSSLARAIALDPRAALGSRVAAAHGGEMPLLVKFVAAEDDLSVQVHPDDASARRLEGEPRGKTEAWHVIAARPGAAIWIGFRPGAVKGRAHLEALARSGGIARALRRVPVAAGETYFLPAGTVHAIGRGVAVLEVQQSSDRTYRLFDWGRPGLDGKPRELHVEKAARVARIAPRAGAGRVAPRRLGGGRERLVACRAFRVERWRLRAGGELERPLAGRFLALVVLSGGARVEAGGASRAARRGDALFVPAAAGTVRVRAAKGAAAELVAIAP